MALSRPALADTARDPRTRCLSPLSEPLRHCCNTYVTTKLFRYLCSAIRASHETPKVFSPKAHLTTNVEALIASSRAIMRMFPTWHYQLSRLHRRSLGVDMFANAEAKHLSSLWQRVLTTRLLRLVKPRAAASCEDVPAEDPSRLCYRPRRAKSRGARSIYATDH